jgi:hypothetical protein
VLLRVNPQSLVAYSASGRHISLLPRLRTVVQSGPVRRVASCLTWSRSGVCGPDGRSTKERPHDATGSSAFAAQSEQEANDHEAGNIRICEVHNCVYDPLQRFDNRSPGIVPFALANRLLFKRLKRLAHLGHVPKCDDRSSRAWLYRKLLVTFLAQKLIRIGRDLSPSGCPVAALWTTESVA